MVAHECFDAELVSGALALLDCIPEKVDSCEALTHRAQCHLSCGRFAECSEMIPISRAQAEDTNLSILLTRISEMINEAQEQKKQWEAELKALNFKSEPILKKKIRKVILLRYLKRFEEALSFVDTIIATQPSDDILAPALFNQAQCYFGMKRYQEALNSCEHCAKLKQVSQVTALYQKIKVALEVSPKLELLIFQIESNSRSALS